MDRWLNKILLGLSEDVLGELPDNCIDSIVTDPPYGLKFMGKKWDYDVPSVALWEEAYRVLKPGAHVLSFGGTRTYHRMVVNIEDAGFEIRDQILWIYGSGFPKSLDVSKAIDKHLGCADERKITHFKRQGPKSMFDGGKPRPASLWDGWGTALKPACEPICLARKPLEGTVANNVLKWGTGGMNIDGSRIMMEDQQHAVDVYKHLSSLYESFCKEPCSVLPYRDFLTYIFSALRSCNIDGKGRLRNEADLDGSLNWGVLCEFLLKTLYPNGIWCDLTENEARDFQSDCPAYSRLYDAHIQKIIMAAQDGSALLADVLEHIGCSQSEHKHNQNYQCNDHLSNGDDSHLAFCFSLLIKLYTAQYNHTTRKSQGRKRHGCGSSDIFPERGNHPDYPLGRFPANVIHDGSDEVLQHFPESNGQQGNVSGLEPSNPLGKNAFGMMIDRHVFPARNDSGSAARFFYCAKASSSERGDENNHPTVKPLNLIKYLIRLITPPDGIVLDMFGGSGTTALACLDLGFPYIVIEKEPDHVFIANERIKQATRQERLFIGDENFFAPKRTPDAPKNGKVADSADEKSIA